MLRVAHSFSERDRTGHHDAQADMALFEVPNNKASLPVGTDRRAVGANGSLGAPAFAEVTAGTAGRALQSPGEGGPSRPTS